MRSRRSWIATRASAACLLAICGFGLSTAQAGEFDWDVHRERVEAHGAVTITSRHFDHDSTVVRTWVRAGGRIIRKTDETATTFLYLTRSLSVVEHYRPRRIVWQVANYTGRPLRVSVGVRKLR